MTPKPQRRHAPIAALWQVVALCVWALLGTGAHADQPLRPAVGNSNPTLAFNLSSVRDFGSGFQFLDLMKIARPWLGHAPGKFGQMSWDDLQAGGYLDDQGWLRRMPEGLAAVGTLWQWGKIPDNMARKAGLYIVTYDGQGTLQFKGDAKVVSQAPGRIVFENRNGKVFFLNIVETDPAGTGDYIRNITMVRQDHFALFEAGAVFNPDWLALIADARQLRFLNWMDTNTPQITTWAQMPTPSSARSVYGYALADMVQLANEVGADPWFTLPHTADDAYVRAFAVYVRDHLDPALQTRVEFSNETWNWRFVVAHWLEDQAIADWGIKGGYADYYVKRSVEVAQIWKDVFGAQASKRLIHVLSGQAMNPGHTKTLLQAQKWKRHDRRGWVDPKTVFDEFAITHYFGGKETAKPELRADFLAAIEKSQGVDYIMAKMRDPRHPSSIPHALGKWTEQAQIVSDAGLRLTAYEGGQHLHHLFGVRLSKPEENALTDFYTAFLTTPEMAELYEMSWASWASVGDGPFMQLTEVGLPTRWGSFGLRQTLDDAPARAQVVDQLNATQTPWWEGAVAGVHYQQGVTLQGDGQANQMIGTSQEDYLIGHDNDDTFIGGPGNDGLHGGAGFDRAIFNGSRSQYTLHAEGKGHRIIGPDGSDRLVAIEEAVFDGGVRVSLSKITQGPKSGANTGTKTGTSPQRGKP